MPYILHSDTNQKFDITGKTAEEVQAVLKAASLVIGNVTVRKLVSGEIKQASGYEVLEDLTEEEQNEINEALAKIETDKELSTNGEGSEATGNLPEVPTPGDAVLDDANAPTVDPVDPASEERNAEIRTRMLGAETGAAVTNVSTAAANKDDAALNSAKDVLKSKANLTPQAATEVKTRRHTKREDLVAQARAGAHAELVTAVEGNVVPGVVLNYMHPDQRWFEFIVKDLADAEKPHARTNKYIDIAPIESGGYGFSLYVNGKSFTKRQKVKEGGVAAVVEQINAWLPGALKDAK